MFRSVTLTDFQSHKSTHLPLGPFTVIVGSSSSGKSAVVRAIRTVVDNARGTSYVRQGAKVCRVALEIAGSEPVLDASTVVTVERGKGVSSYTLRVAGMHNEPIVYTKCASGVPEGIAAALGTGESRLWIAGQFDRPYLLDETGAEVARVLGRLTNVTMVYAAVRETNRRASEVRRSLKSKSEELAEAGVQLQRYANLPLRLQAGQKAEASLAAARSVDTKMEKLRSLLAEIAGAQSRAETARSSIRPVPSVDRLSRLFELQSLLVDRLSGIREAAATKTAASVQVRAVPSMSSCVTLVLRRDALAQMREEVRQSRRTREGCLAQAARAKQLADSAQATFISALHEAGSCPLCGAPASASKVSDVL
jgi:hypothetical protein